MKHKRFYLSLRFQIILGLVAIIALSMAGFYYLQTVLHRRHLIRNLGESSTHYLSNVIKSSLKHAMLTRNLDETRNIMTTVYGQQEVLSIFLVNKRGEIVVSPEDAAIGRRFDLSEPTCEICHRSESKDRPKTVLFTDSEGQDIVRNVSPILNEPECYGCHEPARKVIGMLVTDFSLSGIEERLGREFRQRMVSLAFFLVVVIAVLTLSMERFILARLKRFVAATKRFGRGDFSQDIPEERRDEIGDLAAAFNLMAVDLREYIAERKRAEAEVRRSRDYLNAITNSTHDGLVIIEKDFTISFANEAYARQVSMELEKIIGQPCYRVSHHRDEKCQAPEHECPLNALFETKLPQVAIHCHFDKAGNEMWVEVSGSPMLDEQGEVVRAIEVIRDITERRQSEEALRESEERYRTLYQRTPAMLHSIDRRGRLVSVSDHWLSTLGYEWNEVIGRELTEFMTEESSRYAREVTLPEFFRKGFCRDVSYQFVKKNGEVIDILLSAISERDAEGQVVRSLAILLDVTDRKRAEEELIAAHEKLQRAHETLKEAQVSAIAAEKMAALGRLVTGVAHEVVNPINSIDLVCQYRLRRSGLDNEEKQDLENIREDLRRVVKIADSLKSFARQSPLEFRMIDINTLLRDILLIIESGVLPEDVLVHTDLAEDLPLVAIDPDQIRQVFFNIISNAWDAMPNGGDLCIRTAVSNNAVEVSIKDTGHGISPENLPRIFDPFFTTKPEGKGTGLGLSVCQGIIESHGGSIWAESEAGQGTTFIIQFPLEQTTTGSPT
jgi:PAS domain S-box-containing protein